MNNLKPSAVIATGGKQYRVKVGQKLKIEISDMRTGEPGSQFVFDDESILFVNDGKEMHVGAPYLKGAKVEAKIVQHGRADKVTIIKMRRRKHYRRKQGHRQSFTEIEITNIQAA